MKLQVEYYDQKISIETKNDDLNIEEMHEVWESLLSAMMYSEETIRKFYE